MTSSQTPNPAPTDATARQTVNATTIPGLIFSDQHASVTPPQPASSQVVNPALLPAVPRLPTSRTHPRTSRLLSLAKADKESWEKAKQLQHVQTDVSKVQNVQALSMEPRPEPSPLSTGLATPNVTPDPVETSFVPSPRHPAATGAIAKSLNGDKPKETPTSHASSPGLFSQVLYPHPAHSEATVVKNGAIMAGPSHPTLRTHTKSTLTHSERNVVEGKETVDPSKPDRIRKFGKQEKDGLANCFKDYLMSSKTEAREESASQLAAHFVDAMQDFISPNYDTFKRLFTSETSDGPSSSLSDSISKAHLKRARSPSDDTGDRRPFTRLKFDLEGHISITDGDSRTVSSPRPRSVEISSQANSHRLDTDCDICVFYPPGGPFRRDMTLEFDSNELILLHRWANRHNAFDRSLPCLSCTLACVALPDLAEYPKDKSQEEIINSLAIEWPQEGGFSISLRGSAGVTISLPIAPPSLIRNCEPIDLTTYLKLKTIITFTSTRDYSKYALVIRVHEPTQSQLRQFHQASSILSPSPDAWSDLRLIERPLSPVRLLFTDLSL